MLNVKNIKISSCLIILLGVVFIILLDEFFYYFNNKKSPTFLIQKKGFCGVDINDVNIDTDNDGYTDAEEVILNFDRFKTENIADIEKPKNYKTTIEELMKNIKVVPWIADRQKKAYEKIRSSADVSDEDLKEARLGGGDVGELYTIAAMENSLNEKYQKELLLQVLPYIKKIDGDKYNSIYTRFELMPVAPRVRLVINADGDEYSVYFLIENFQEGSPSPVQFKKITNLSAPKPLSAYDNGGFEARGIPDYILKNVFAIIGKTPEFKDFVKKVFLRERCVDLNNLNIGWISFSMAGEINKGNHNLVRVSFEEANACAISRPTIFFLVDPWDKKIIEVKEEIMPSSCVY